MSYIAYAKLTFPFIMSYFGILCYLAFTLVKFKWVGVSEASKWSKLAFWCSVGLNGVSCGLTTLDKLLRILDKFWSKLGSLIYYASITDNYGGFLLYYSNLAKS